MTGKPSPKLLKTCIPQGGTSYPILFRGYSSYYKQPPFDASLFVDIRKRLSPVNRLSYVLLNKSREITEEIIDELHAADRSEKKPRTYRKIARKAYLKVAQNKNPSKKVIRKGIKSQLQYLRRNFRTIEKMLDGFEVFPLNHKLQRKYWIIQTVYDQQLKMWVSRSHQVEYRIVSIHEPHVRLIIRGKARAKTEFGAKIHMSMVDGFGFLDMLFWDAFNEGKHLKDYVEEYRSRFGFYPA